MEQTTTSNLKIHRRIELKTIRKKRHQAIINIAISFLGFFLLTVSCQQDTIYHSYQPVASTGWNKNDTICFSLPTSIYSDSYEYEIGVRHLYSYKYKDIWLTINQDTIHLYLADSVGHWKGNGIGEMRQFTQLIKLHTIQHDSIKDFHLKHIMNDSLLTGIQDVGIQIKRRSN